MNKIKEIRNEIKWSFQKTKKGYCDYDLYDISSWFVGIFPKMLEEFIECTCGHPMYEQLSEDVMNMPIDWVEKQIDYINSIESKYDEEFDLYDGMCCWLLILLRMKYCIERCDEKHPCYDKYWERGSYEVIDTECEKYKEEGLNLFHKYFWNLWW